MMNQTLAAGQPVLFIDAGKKSCKGVITEVLGQLTARLDLSEAKKAAPGMHTAIADYSEGGEPGTFTLVPETPAKA